VRRAALLTALDAKVTLLTSAHLPLLPCRALVGEGRVDALRVYGPEQMSAIVTLKASAPGGARQCKVRAGLATAAPSARRCFVF
jgi:hypothetical protein